MLFCVSWCVFAYMPHEVSMDNLKASETRNIFPFFMAALLAITSQFHNPPPPPPSKSHVYKVCALVLWILQDVFVVVSPRVEENERA